MVTPAPQARGFSLLELLLALSITLGISAIGFRLFLQNEQAFQRQSANAESEQNARAVLTQIADEIRHAGQGVPIFAATYDGAATEAAAVILSGSDTAHLRMREGFSNIETTVTTTPADYVLDVSRSVSVEDAAAFSTALGTTTPDEKFVFIQGSGSLSCWSWVRAQLTSIQAAFGTLTLTPRQSGEQCHVDANTLRFTSTQSIALEEAVSIYISGGSVWRAASADFSNPAAPSWNSASELGRDVETLSFTYFDKNDEAIFPSSLAARLAVVRIDVRLLNRSGYELRTKVFPRNLRIR